MICGYKMVQLEYKNKKYMNMLKQKKSQIVNYACSIFLFKEIWGTDSKLMIPDYL